jgi:hypothetical protein
MECQSSALGALRKIDVMQRKQRNRMPSLDDRQPVCSPNERKICILLIIIGLALIGFFGFRAVRSYIRLEHMGLQPGTSNVDAIRGWMTVPYIAKAYNVPEEHLFTALKIPANENQKRSLAQIQHAYDFGEKGAIIEAVKAAIQQYQQTPRPQIEPRNE